MIAAGVRWSDCSNGMKSLHGEGWGAARFSAGVLLPCCAPGGVNGVGQDALVGGLQIDAGSTASSPATFHGNEDFREILGEVVLIFR